VDEMSVLMGYDDASLDMWFLCFEKTHGLICTFQPLNITSLHHLEMLETKYPVSQLHTSEEQICMHHLYFPNFFHNKMRTVNTLNCIPEMATARFTGTSVEI
jgi:hypothetical protein